jgi:hypothetical protein
MSTTQLTPRARRNKTERYNTMKEQVLTLTAKVEKLTKDLSRALDSRDKYRSLYAQAKNELEIFNAGIKFVNRPKQPTDPTISGDHVFTIIKESKMNDGRELPLWVPEIGSKSHSEGGAK